MFLLLMECIMVWRLQLNYLACPRTFYFIHVSFSSFTCCYSFFSLILWLVMWLLLCISSCFGEGDEKHGASLYAFAAPSQGGELWLCAVDTRCVIFTQSFAGVRRIQFVAPPWRSRPSVVVLCCATSRRLYCVWLQFVLPRKQVLGFPSWVETQVGPSQSSPARQKPNPSPNWIEKIIIIKLD